MASRNGEPVETFATRNAWERWLADQHDSLRGVWLELAKRGSGLERVSRADALEVALCYGWIDAQAAPLDDRRWLQRYTPRGRRSKWSKINRAKALDLIDRGAMQPSGLREVERAQADGRWEAAYDSPRTAAVPDDLRLALDQNHAARAFFDALDGQNRYAILYRVQDAKRPETRARRIAQFVEMLAEGRKIHPS